MSAIQVRGFLVDLEKIDWQLRAASDNMRSPCARGLLRAAHISFGPVLESAVAVRWKQPVGPPGLFQEGAMTKGTWPWALSPLVSAEMRKQIADQGWGCGVPLRGDGKDGGRCVRGGGTSVGRARGRRELDAACAGPTPRQAPTDTACAGPAPHGGELEHECSGLPDTARPSTENITKAARECSGLPDSPPTPHTGVQT